MARLFAIVLILALALGFVFLRLRSCSAFTLGQQIQTTRPTPGEVAQAEEFLQIRLPDDAQVLGLCLSHFQDSFVLLKVRIRAASLDGLIAQSPFQAATWSQNRTGVDSGGAEAPWWDAASVPSYEAMSVKRQTDSFELVKVKDGDDWVVLYFQLVSM